MTMVFYGKVDRPGGPYPIVSADVESMIEHAGNWKVHTGGAQDGKSHGVCGPVDAQTASGDLTRFHVRLFANYDLDLKGRREVFATPHYEEFGTCGHAVASNTSNISGSGFDQGRIQLTNLMVNDGYSIGDNQNWGNTQNFMQCNGDIAGSTGSVYWILTH
ncbi:hypothetical protein AB0L40_17985 [Patulibacter sp. NPDC049589]|uniref:hypothetical protein n=1 Tax=Patulibacter sp. NPDC049589 TaxID=3154731 RepID=UPI0034460393